MQVGFYQAIVELGVSFDLVIGSSVGALNGALISAEMPPTELAKLWRGLKKPDVLAWNWRALRGETGGLYTFTPLRRLLHEVLPIRCFEELKHSLIITTTNLQTGQSCYHERQGDLIDPVIASMSLPGAFPPVWIAGHQHVDGGVADNVPFDKALDCGARELLMISCTCCPWRSTALASPLKILLRSFMIALDTKYPVQLATAQVARHPDTACTPEFFTIGRLARLRSCRRADRSGIQGNSCHIQQPAFELYAPCITTFTRSTVMSEPSNDLVSCCACCKDIPLDAAFTPEGAEYVEHFCGLECYQRFLARGKAATETKTEPSACDSPPCSWS